MTLRKCLSGWWVRQAGYPLEKPMGPDLCGRTFRLGALILVLIVPLGASAQEASPDLALMLETFPTATRFGPATGTPSVYEAYGSDPSTGQEVLLGYLFLTSDWPPELKGYTSTIKTLVGMDLTGEITGARVIEYYESLRSSRGDFLRGNAFERQFAGKDVRDAFRIRRDLFTISGATVPNSDADAANIDTGVAISNGGVADSTEEVANKCTKVVNSGPEVQIVMPR